MNRNHEKKSFGKDDSPSGEHRETRREGNMERVQKTEKKTEIKRDSEEAEGIWH